MRNFRIKLLAGACAVLAVFVVQAEMMDRPVGIRIGQRMTLKPYVALSATYDSNADGGKNGNENVYWTVNPGFGLDYRAENWSLVANVSYQYHAYSKKRVNSQDDYHGITENIAYRWSNSRPGERGWSLMLSQTYQKTFEDKDMNSGLEYGTDRQTFTFSGALQRRFSHGFHSDLNAAYYLLNYNNNNNNKTGQGLYGWDRVTVGGELGWAPSRWTDLLVTGNYQHYNQDNADNSFFAPYSNKPGSRSDGYTVHGGIGSYATDRITYRLLAGWSRFEYGGSSGRASDGFTYSVSGNWTISETWRTMLLATSYFQPTERDYGSSQRVDSLSWGLSHAMVQGKMHATFDIVYRHETPEYVWTGERNGQVITSRSDYSLDTLTFRLGLNYTLNRYLSLFTHLSYRTSSGSGKSQSADAYTYDRYSATLGLRFTY